VSRVTPTEDGARVELALEYGRLVAIAGDVPPRVGDQVGVRVDGGARFALDGTP
jgi:hypothetical protein